MLSDCNLNVCILPPSMSLATTPSIVPVLSPSLRFPLIPPMPDNLACTYPPSSALEQTETTFHLAPTLFSPLLLPCRLPEQTEIKFDLVSAVTELASQVRRATVRTPLI